MHVMVLLLSLSLIFVDSSLLVNGNGVASRPGVRHSSEPRKRFPASGSSDEDPYTLTPSGSSGSSGKGNKEGHHHSRLPPGEKEYFGPQNWAKVIKPIRPIRLAHLQLNFLSF